MNLGFIRKKLIKHQVYTYYVYFMLTGLCGNEGFQYLDGFFNAYFLSILEIEPLSFSAAISSLVNSIRPSL
jgi:hypothetical protein